MAEVNLSGVKGEQPDFTGRRGNHLDDALFAAVAVDALRFALATPRREKAFLDWVAGTIGDLRSHTGLVPSELIAAALVDAGNSLTTRVRIAEALTGETLFEQPAAEDPGSGVNNGGLAGG